MPRFFIDSLLRLSILLGHTRQLFAAVRLPVLLGLLHHFPIVRLRVVKGDVNAGAEYFVLCFVDTVDYPAESTFGIQ